MAAVLLLLCQLFCLSLVHPAMGKCPDVNRAVNCSFSASEDCLKAYVKQDKHGLKWKTRRGSLTNRYIDRPRYTEYYVTILDNSPDRSDYALIQATNDSRAWGLWTELVSPPFTADNHGCLYFHFHNSVCKENPLESAFKVAIRLDSNYRISNMNPNDDVVLREFPCIKGSGWFRAMLPVVGVSGIYRIVFAAQQHGDYNKVIAVDNVMYTDESCSIQDDSSFVEGDCDFEDTDLCRYRTWNDDGSTLAWRVVQKEMFPEDNQKSAPKGYFLAVWGKDDRHSNEMIKVYAESPKVTIERDACLSMMYYSSIYYPDNNITALVVSRSDGPGQSENLIHQLPATLGTEPIRAFVPLPEGTYAIRFTAQLFPPFGPDDVIGLDDVEIHNKPCDDIRCDDALCAVSQVDHCSGRGQCLGSGLKHKSCLCSWPYIGKTCDSDSSSSSMSSSNRPYDYFYHG